MNTDFVFRNVKESDKAEVSALCKDIWDGTDYIPLVFDKWIKAPGRFIACLFDNEIVGLVKVSFVAQNHVWIEGLRKKPSTKLHGVGKALMTEAIRTAKALPNIKSIRFSTHIDNIESIRLNEALGFVRIREFASIFMSLNEYKSDWYKNFDVSLLHSSSSKFCVNDIEHDSDAMQKILTRLHKASFFEDFRTESWKMYPLTECKEIKDSDKIKTITDKQSGKIVACCVLSVDDDEKVINIVAFDADSVESTAWVFLVAEQFARQKSYTDISCEVPPESKLVNFARELKWLIREDGNSFFLYEYPKSLLSINSNNN